MAMTILNNSASMMTLGELNKNITKVGKSLAKISTGQKIVNASDNASEYGISEQMRAKIRALEQDVQNVQNGSAMLKSAEEGIQQQIEILKTIREKVIDANNDSNSDEDRRIIQKEIDQFLDQMEQDAYYTDYNTKKVLIGDTYKKSISTWFKLSDPIPLPGSEIDVIDNAYPDNGKVNAPFDTFQNKYGEYQSPTASTFPDSNPINANNLVDDASALEFQGGDDSGKAAVLEIDFANIDMTALQNVKGGTGLRIIKVNKNGYTNYDNFVLTTETTSDTEKFSVSPEQIYIPKNKDYDKLDNIVDISSGNISQMVSDIASQLTNQTDYFSKVEVNGTKLILTSANKSALSNNMKIEGFSVEERYVKTGEAAEFSQTITIPGNALDENGNIVKPYNTGSITIPDGLTGGIIVDNFSLSRFYVRELNGNHEGIEHLSTTPYTWDFTNYSTLETTCTISGTEYYYTSDESDYDVHYKNINKFSGAESEFTTKGEDPKDAHLDIDLSGYTNVEDLVNDFVGKSIRYNKYNRIDDNRGYYNIYSYCEFYDSKSETINQAVTINKNETSVYYFDLNKVRQDVANGKTIAQAFATNLKKYYALPYRTIIDVNDDFKSKTI